MNADQEKIAEYLATKGVKIVPAASANAVSLRTLRADACRAADSASDAQGAVVRDWDSPLTSTERRAIARSVPVYRTDHNGRVSEY